MQDYKLQQMYYNKITTHTDDICELEHSIDLLDKAIIDYAVNYFKTEVNTLIFPGKSFAVAIIYSYWIHKYFGTPFFESLDDPQLFLKTDKYFVPYSKAKYIYDDVLKKISFYNPDFKMNTNLSQIKATTTYFRLEFNVGEYVD